MIFGFGFKLLKLVKVKVFLDSAGLVQHAGAATLVDAGLSLCDFKKIRTKKDNKYNFQYSIKVYNKFTGKFMSLLTVKYF